MEVGYYEIEIKSLKPTKKNKKKKIKEIKYRFYVPEMVNGYMLPIEPEQEANNASLIGIDINSNGVRDDVERKIIKKYSKKLHIELLMDGARQFQKIMDQSTGNAIDLQKNMSRIIACEIYLGRVDIEIRSDDFESIEYLENNTFNNPERVRKYLDYNSALSGGVYGNTGDAYKKESCSQETVTVLEEMGL